jgi:hypothetical protein
LQAAIDELLAKAVDKYSEEGLAVVVEMLTAEPPEPPAKPAEQPEKKAEEGHPQ